MADDSPHTVYLYNTMSREKEELRPLHDSRVGIYTCGPTVYNFAHIGNFRTFIFEDVLVRMLRYVGYDVTHVMNITDVGHLSSDADEGEDKMIKAMRREGKGPYEIADFYTEAFFNDSDRLNVNRPDIVPRATQHIDEMIELISCLMDKGHGYIIQDGVYYDVSTFPSYGRLSRASLEEQEAGARVEVNAEKRNPADFALWKIADARHAMQWDSPWGRGYPGWHVECSAMSMEYLGKTFDIHCGGVDHIPIHHENEIAQSEGCTGVEFARIWMHAEFLLINAGKMSKSAGALGEGGAQKDMGEGIEPLNTGGGGFLTVQSFLDQGIDPLAYRYFCLTAKYRAQLNYTEEAIRGAGRALEGLYGFVTRAMEAREKAGNATTTEAPEWVAPYQERFVGAITDDLNMPAALAALHDLITEANRREEAASVLSTLFDWDRVLGLRFEETAKERLSHALPAEVQALIDERQAARKARDFRRADEIRAQLRTMGYEIEDTPQGVRWNRV